MERLLVMIFVCSCSGQNVAAPTRLEIVVPEIALAKGESTQLTARLQLDDGTLVDRTQRVTWHSSNPAVALIHPDGTLEGRSAGSAFIDAITVEGYSAEEKIEIAPARLVGLALSSVYPSHVEGNPWYLSVAAIYTDEAVRDATQRVSWSSSDVAVAAPGRVAGEYLPVEARRAGNARITARLGELEAFTTLSVVPPPPERLEVRVTRPAMAPGDVAWLHAVGTYADGSERDLAPWVGWRVSGDSVAVVPSAEGTKLIAGRAGHAVVIALYNEQVASVEIDVSNF